MKVLRFCRDAGLSLVAAAAFCVTDTKPAWARYPSSIGCDCAPNSTAPGDMNALPSDSGLGQLPNQPSASPEGAPSANLSEEQFASLGGDTIGLAQSNVAYIDSAPISTQFRLRFDAAYNMDRPDRAEYYYTTWQVFGGQFPNPPQGRPDPDVDFQMISPYFEYAITDRLSLFAETPILFNNPSRNENHAGLGDVQAGFKWGLSSCCDRQLTFQLNNYFPTGDAEGWLTSGHYSIEPGLLYFQQWSDRITLEAEFKDWISIDGAVNPQNGRPYAGNVLEYGLGLGYDWRQVGNWKLTPVVEFVGWTVLEGQVFEFDAQGNDLAPADAAGDTIVNAKLGLRFTHCAGGSLYAGYGRALTGDRWYEDIIRLEYRRTF